MKKNRKIKKKSADPFRWLEKNSPKRKEWIKKEKKETDRYLSECSDRNILRKRIAKMFDSNEMRVPISRGKMYFFRYRKAREEQPSIYFKKGLSGKEKLLINPNLFPKKIRIVKSWTVSKDARFIALELSSSGNDRNSIKIFDVRKRKFTKDNITDESYPYFSAWEANSDGFWYIRKGSSKKRGDIKYDKKIYFHKIGSNSNKDRLFWGQKLEEVVWPNIKQTDEGKHLLITVNKQDMTTEIFFQKGNHPKQNFTEITKGMKAESFADINGEYIYLYTNHKASRNQILRRKIYQNGKLGKWEKYIREKKYKLEKWELMKDYIFLEYLVNAHSELYAIGLNNKLNKKIDLPSIGSIGTFSAEFGGNELFYTFSSFTNPVSIYRINIKKFSKTLFWSNNKFKYLKKFITVQKWYESRDKTKVPVFLTYNRNLKLNGNNPTILYAYGGFGVSLTPAFWKSIIPFLEDGGVFALANIRGGGEFGKYWHKSAIKKNRRKSFDDFSHAVKYLFKKRYTNQQKISIMGGSNGGLLMSVIILEHPELVKAAVIENPVTDMMRFHLFDGGKWWISEYGDPDDPNMKKFLLSYSPYHNVKNKNYPSALFATSDADDRVSPMHTYKMIAKMKSGTKQKNPVLLRLEEGAGHSGANLKTSIINQLADEMAFIYKELDIKKTKK